MTELLRYMVENRVAHLTLNRPEARNALSPELVAALIVAIRNADADPAVKCLLLQGEGEHLSAGGDVKGFNELLATPQHERYDLFERKVLVGNRLPQAMLDARKPVVVVARGAVAGAGLGLCLAADYVLCGESSYFMAAHVHVGLAVDCGLSGLLVGAMGIKAAKRLALLGERITAAQALELGIVTEVLPDADLPAAAQLLTQKLAAGPAVAMACTKQLLNTAAFGNFPQQLVQEATAVARCAATDDFAAGVQAAVSRQRAVFA